MKINKLLIKSTFAITLLSTSAIAMAQSVNASEASVSAMQTPQYNLKFSITDIQGSKSTLAYEMQTMFIADVNDPSAHKVIANFSQEVAFVQSCKDIITNTVKENATASATEQVCEISKTPVGVSVLLKKDFIEISRQIVRDVRVIKVGEQNVEVPLMTTLVTRLPLKMGNLNSSSTTLVQAGSWNKWSKMEKIDYTLTKTN